jgi:hypothetical protein
VVIDDPADFDEVVQGWLVEAYELSR